MKYITYKKDADTMELVKIFNKAKKERLKLAYELKFTFGQELLTLYTLIKKQQGDIERMVFEAKQDRKNLESDNYLSIH